MTNNSNKKARFIAAIILTIAILNFIIPRNAHAATSTTSVANQALFAASGGLLGSTGSTDGFLKKIVECVSDGVVSCSLTAVAGAIAYMSSVFISIAGYLVNLSLSLNLNINQTVVQTGWNITNALANLGFVLFIVIIAFATVVRWQGYGLKDILWKLITAALIVNFSLMIAFVFIDFSNVLTKHFLGVTGNSVKIAGELAKAFKIQQIQEVVTSASSTTAIKKEIPNDNAVRLISVLFQIIFNFIIVMTLLAVAAMLLVRFIALNILLILAPLTWLFWITPATSKYWNQWWDSFIKWIIFAPAVSFFIYLAINIPAIMTQEGIGITNLTGSAQENIPGGAGTYIANFLSQIGNMIVIVGLLLGGLITANKMGIAGSAMFYKAVQKTGKAAQGWVGRTAARGASYPLRTDAGRKLTEKLQQAGSSSNRFVRALARPLRTAGSAIADQRIAAENYNMKAAKKSLASLSHQELARRIDISSGPEKAYILSTLAKAKKMDLLPKRSRRALKTNGEWFKKTEVDWNAEQERKALLYGQHETFKKTKTIKFKDAEGRESTFEMPDDEEAKPKQQPKPSESSKPVDEFGRPIT